MKKTKLPDFFLIGAMKAGTSSLHMYLNGHDKINMSSIKEPNFYSKIRTPFHKGMKWYQSLFLDGDYVRGESSTAYSKHPYIRGVSRRIHQKQPDAKFIYLLRHPIDRTVSHVSHDILEGLLPQMNFIDGMVRQKENNVYVDCSKYMQQLDAYLNYFPKERFLVLSHDDLKSNPEKTVEDVLRFLNVKGEVDPEVFLKKRNVSKERTVIQDREAYKKALRLERKGKAPKGSAEQLRVPFIQPEITEVAAVELMEDLKQDLERLYDFCGRDFNWTV